MVVPDEFPQDSAQRAVAEVHALLDEVVERARDAVGRVDDPRAQTLLATTAEAVRGLATAYRHYQRGSEDARG